MPIPSFDANSVLPPHLGDPRERGQLSPYPCTCLELCQRFSNTPERRSLLDGFLRFQQLLIDAGFANTFQWIDGSFLEDVEAREGRAPADIDVVTFFVSPDAAFTARVLSAQPILADHGRVKTQFLIDHYFVDLSYNPIFTVESVRYWTGLFSHRRDGIWKGMLRIDLNPTDYTAARDFLRSLP